MAIQVRRGNESDFDASKMLPGEWAVSLDTKYVRMCFAPGVVLRMATYEGFEADKAQFQAILAECKSIQSAVQRIQAEVNSKASLVVEYSNNAKTSADKAHSEAERAKTYADNAEAVTGVQIATKERAGLIKGGDNYIAEDGTLMLITTTTSTTQPNSYAGRLKVDEIGGVCEQESTSGKNLLENTATSKTINGVTFTVNEDGSVTANGTASATTTFVIASQDTYIATNDSTYTLSGCPANGSDNSYYIYYQEWDSAWGDLISVTDYGNGVLMKHNDNAVYSRMSIGIAKGVTCNNLTFKPMIRLASITDGTYEPYTGGIPAPNPSYPMEIKKSVVSGVKTHWKNFLNLSTDRMNKLTYANGIYTSIPCGAWAMLQVYLINGVKMRVGKKYYLKAKIRRISGSGEINTFALEPAKTRQMVNIPNLTDSFQEYVAELYVDSDSVANTVCTIQPNGTAIDLVLEIKDIILCEDLEAEYQPYTESSYTFSQPIELYGIGDVQDVIVPKEIKRRFASVVFDGSDDEAWVTTQTTVGDYRVMIPIANIKRVKDADTMPLLLCTDYIANTPTDNYNNAKEGITSATGSNSLLVYDKNYNTADVSLWKAHLQANPITVVHELAEETTEALPIADQIGLNSLQTYDGITYVEFDSEIQPTFKAEYGTSKVGGYTLESLLTARNNELKQDLADERLSALEASVVNNI